MTSEVIVFVLIHPRTGLGKKPFPCIVVQVLGCGVPALVTFKAGTGPEVRAGFEARQAWVQTPFLAV